MVENMTSRSRCTGRPVAYENEAIQSSEIDFRVDGITQKEVHNDKENMEEITKQVEKRQDETTSQSINKDLQEGVLLTTETSLEVKNMGDIALHEVRKTNSEIPTFAVLNSHWRRNTILPQMRSRYKSGWFRNDKTSTTNSRTN